MHIVIVDPKASIEPKVGPVLRARGWGCTASADVPRSVAAVINETPDAILIHGDGASGEAAHLCQRFKQNALTAGIPLILIEDATPPAWLLAGMPADAVVQSPWDTDELMHHVEAFLPVTSESGSLDDLTNLPRRASILNDVARRMLARELFGVGILSLREAEAYRQDYGRNGLDQFVVLVSVLLRRHASGASLISVGYLEEGSFLVVGSTNAVHEVIAQTTRDFDALVPAYYEMDTLFGKDDDHDVGPATWIGLQGAVCLIEPDRYENQLQIGLTLSDTLTSGAEAIQQSMNRSGVPASNGLAAD